LQEWLLSSRAFSGFEHELSMRLTCASVDKRAAPQAISDPLVLL
jgi:hypothetical protein